MAIACAIWFCGNKRVHEDVHSFPRRPLHLSAVAWSCHPFGMTKLNVDAHVIDSYVGLGVVARDEVGNILLTATKGGEVGLKVDVAEAMTVRYGCSYSKKIRVR